MSLAAPTAAAKDVRLVFTSSGASSASASPTSAALATGSSASKAQSTVSTSSAAAASSSGAAAKASGAERLGWPSLGLVGVMVLAAGSAALL